MMTDWTAIKSRKHRQRLGVWKFLLQSTQVYQVLLTATARPVSNEGNIFKSWHFCSGPSVHFRLIVMKLGVLASISCTKLDPNQTSASRDIACQVAKWTIFKMYLFRRYWSRSTDQRIRITNIRWVKTKIDISRWWKTTTVLGVHVSNGLETTLA